MPSSPEDARCVATRPRTRSPRATGTPATRPPLAARATQSSAFVSVRPTHALPGAPSSRTG
eukprot:8042254-Alexandrium_andersonii.AAC.1